MRNNEGDSSAILLSVVVPVYNVLPYLDECFDSIASQLVDGVEVILVDDGSTDGSGERCDEFEGLLDCVTVIHKKNSGLASARNTGMRIARGRYVSFVDSDDCIAPGSISRIISWSCRSEADICFLECEKFFPDGSRKPFGCVIRSKDMVEKTADEALAFLSDLDKFPDAAGLKLYRRSFLEEFGLCFPDDGRYSEDLGFAIDCFLSARSFAALDGPFYEYRQGREGSITNSISSKHFFDLVTFIEESLGKLTNNEGLPRNFRCECCLSFVAYELSIMIWMMSMVERDEKGEALRTLREFVWVMQYGRGRKAMLTRVAVKAFGIRVASGLLSLYMRWR